MSINGKTSESPSENSRSSSRERRSDCSSCRRRREERNQKRGESSDPSPSRVEVEGNETTKICGLQSDENVSEVHTVLPKEERTVADETLSNCEDIKNHEERNNAAHGITVNPDVLIDDARTEVSESSGETESENVLSEERKDENPTPPMRKIRRKIVRRRRARARVPTSSESSSRPRFLLSNDKIDPYTAIIHNIKMLGGSPPPIHRFERQIQRYHQRQLSSKNDVPPSENENSAHDTEGQDLVIRNDSATEAPTKERMAVRDRNAFVRIEVNDDEGSSESDRNRNRIRGISIKWVVSSVIVVCSVVGVLGYSSWFTMTNILTVTSNRDPSRPTIMQSPSNNIVVSPHSNAGISNVIIAQSSPIEADLNVALQNTLSGTHSKILKRETASTTASPVSQNISTTSLSVVNGTTMSPTPSPKETAPLTSLRVTASGSTAEEVSSQSMKCSSTRFLTICYAHYVDFCILTIPPKRPNNQMVRVYKDFELSRDLLPEEATLKKSRCGRKTIYYFP